jgi:hypothetical protein
MDASAIVKYVEALGRLSRETEARCLRYWEGPCDGYWDAFCREFARNAEPLVAAIERDLKTVLIEKGLACSAPDEMNATARAVLWAGWIGWMASAKAGRRDPSGRTARRACRLVNRILAGVARAARRTGAAGAGPEADSRPTQPYRGLDAFRGPPPDGMRACRLYVYGNGKWHCVKTREVQASVQFLSAHCGGVFTEEHTTTDDPAVMTSAHYCSACMNALRGEEARHDIRAR